MSQLWDETQCPWIDLAEIRVTTPLTCSALRRTYFNITDKPTCLRFTPPESVHDYRSYHRVCCTVYTTMEIKRCGDPKFARYIASVYRHPSMFVSLYWDPVEGLMFTNIVRFRFK